MPTMIALLRSVNVGARTVKMDRLKAVFEEMGFAAVRTYIQSGNVLFEAGTAAGPELTGYVESGLRAALGFEVAAVLLTPGELAELLADNPFAGVELREGERLHVTVLKAEPGAEALARMKPHPASRDEYRVRGRAVWILCRDGYGRTVYTNSFFESKMKTVATTRNLETMTALAELGGAGQNL